MIYVDCTECIPDGSVTFHGGGNYGKRMVKLLSKEKSITVFLPDGFNISNEDDKQVFINKNVNIRYITDLCLFDEYNAGDTLFLPLLPTRRLFIIKKIKEHNPEIKVYITIHGTRLLDLKPDLIDEYYHSHPFKIIRWLINNIKYFIYSTIYKRTYSKFVPYFDKVFTVSNDSMQKIQSICSPKTIKPFYCGSINSDITITQQRRDANFALLVSGGRPEKNAIRTILGFQEFKKRDRTGLKLVITGVPEDKRNLMLSYPGINKELIADCVELLPYVDERKLKDLYNSCKFAVCLSKSEGFGLAMIESVLSNIPIMTSSITALPEVLWSGAIYVNPYSVESIARGYNEMVINYNSILKKIGYRKTVVQESINSSDKDFISEFE